MTIFLPPAPHLVLLILLKSVLSAAGEIKLKPTRMQSVRNSSWGAGCLSLMLRRVKDHAPKKGLSLRKLAQHQDIGLTYASLSNAVNLAVQERVLSKLKQVEHLSESHKLLLLQVEADADKLKYARKVEKEGLSTRALKELLFSEEIIEQRGRPLLSAKKPDPLPEVSVASLLEPFAPLESFSLESIPFSELSVEQRQAAIEVAERTRAKLQALIERLQSVTP